MSAFMCSKETIWDIASYICINFKGGAKDIFEVYKGLVDLNVSALVQRYGA